MTSEEWHNPYFEEVAGGVTVGPNRLDWTDRHIGVMTARMAREESQLIPDDTPVDHLPLVEHYAWAIPNEAAIEAIAEYDPILEVGAGRGYWTYLLRQLDVDVIATDPEVHPNEEMWSTVWKAKAEDVVPDYLDRTLFMCWPSYGGQWATAALGMYQGETFIYVGEGRGGCTATDRFHQMLHEEWELEETVAIPQYTGIHDRLEIWVQP